MQLRQFCLTPNKIRPRGWWVTHPLEFLNRDSGVQHASRFSRDRGDESVPQPMDGFDITRGPGRVTQRFTQLAHTHGKRRISDTDAGPDCPPELIFSDQLASVRYQITKYIKGFRRQYNRLLAAPQSRVGYVQPKGIEDKHRLPSLCF